MPTEHPYYSGKLIYWAKNGDLPVGGAFYAPASGQNLSFLASKACNGSKYWRNINMNTWNRENLVYREYSQNCYSPKTNPDKALSTYNPSNPGSYIALCQNDTTEKDKAIGSKYPILWIPEGCDAAASIQNVPVAKPKTPDGQVQIPTLPTVFPSTIFKPITTTVTTLPKISPIAPMVPTGPSTGPIGPGTVPTTPQQQYTPSGPDGPPFGPEAEGWPWWVWALILGGGATVGAVAYKKSKKGRK